MSNVIIAFHTSYMSSVLERYKSENMEIVLRKNIGNILPDGTIVFHSEPAYDEFDKQLSIYQGRKPSGAPSILQLGLVDITNLAVRRILKFNIADSILKRVRFGPALRPSWLNFLEEYIVPGDLICDILIEWDEPMTQIRLKRAAAKLDTVMSLFKSYHNSHQGSSMLIDEPPICHESAIQCGPLNVSKLDIMPFIYLISLMITHLFFESRAKRVFFKPRRSK